MLSENKISDLYNKLYSLTQVSQEVKQKHIQDIENYKDVPDMNDKERAMQLTTLISVWMEY